MSEWEDEYRTKGVQIFFNTFTLLLIYSFANVFMLDLDKISFILML
jgi:hypothetical protein